MKEEIKYTIWAKTQIAYFRRKGYSDQQILSYRTNRKDWRTDLWETMVLSRPERQPIDQLTPSLTHPLTT